jgi:hypothetical protein
VVVLAATEPKLDGSVIAELQRLASNGTIRVLDLMVLAMGDDGAVYGLDIEDLAPDDAASLAFIETGTRGLFDAEDSATIAEGMVPGSIVVGLAIENKWAVGLLNAFEAAGTELALHTRIPAVLVDDALAGIAGSEG